MTIKRKISVNILAMIAFVLLFLLPLIAFSATDTSAVQTAQSASSFSDDYVFYIISNDDVPLAAAPTANSSGYVLLMALAAYAIMIVFVYSGWYLSVCRNLSELSGKLSAVDRRSFLPDGSFFHPVRLMRLSREAENRVASMYTKYL